MLAWAAPAGAGITFAQLDDFTDGTTMNWSEGSISSNPPVNVATGGPLGAGDAYLQNFSAGGFGGGSKQIMFNQAQWTGNYNAANVTRIEGMMANFGTTTLNMRVAISGGLVSTRFGSTNPVVLPPDGVWRRVAFNLDASGMSLIAGSDSLSTVLGGVVEVRLLSSSFGPSYTGDVINSTLGVDKLRADRLPGDASFDGIVNTTDFNLLAGNFGGSGKSWGQADFTFDGNVDTTDFNILAGNFGKSVTFASASSALGSLVPEPSSLALLALAGGALARRRSH